MDEILEMLAAARQIAIHHIDGSVYFWKREAYEDITLWMREGDEVERPISLENTRMAELIVHYGLFVEVEAVL